MSNLLTSTTHHNASQSKLNSSSLPPTRRVSVFSSRTPSKDRLHPKDSFSAQHHSEAFKKTPVDTPKERKVASQPENFNAPRVPKYHHFMNQTQGAAPIRRSKLRVTRVWQHPDDLKFKGLWQQYEDLWFGIHSESVEPLLEEYPLPTITKSLNDVSEPHEHQDKVALTPQPEKKRKEYQIRLMSNRLKKLEEQFIPCAHCKEKKRRGVEMRCKHYFCRECLRDHVQSHIDQLKVPIKCMVPDCHHELDRAEIIKHASNSENVMKYFDLNVTDYVRRRPHKMIQCFTQRCKHVIDITRLRIKNQFKCPSCHIAYCIACHKQVKRGHACEDSNNLESMNGPRKQLMSVHV